MAIELIFTALIIFCALNQKYPVRYFIDYGATKKTSGQFHKTGGGIRIIAAVLGALGYFYRSGEVANSIAYFFLLLTIAWLVFNLALNIATKGPKRLFFIGSTAGIDNRLTKWFGDMAGEIQAAACLLIIILLELAILNNWIVRAVEIVRAWLN
jgi:hypothetical protein